MNPELHFSSDGFAGSVYRLHIDGIHVALVASRVRVRVHCALAHSLRVSRPLFQQELQRQQQVGGLGLLLWRPTLPSCQVHSIACHVMCNMRLQPIAVFRY
jgi:hypothetical protein